MQPLKDNIGDSTVDAAQDALTDDYLKRFEDIENNNKKLVAIVKGFDSQPDDQQRLYAVMQYVRELQKHNDAMFDLLVEMNNFFGTK